MYHRGMTGTAAMPRLRVAATAANGGEGGTQAGQSFFFLHGRNHCALIVVSRFGISLSFGFGFGFGVCVCVCVCVCVTHSEPFC